MLVVWSFLWIDPDGGVHARVDNGGDHIVDDGCEVPIVLDLAVVGRCAGQLILIHSSLD